MSFPKVYKCLKRQIFECGEYRLLPIRYEDRMDIMKWRNEQIYHLRQTQPLTFEDQNKYFNEVVRNLFNQSHPQQILFSYLKDNICIGYGGLVHINWLDQNAEISFIIDTALEELYFDFHWQVFLKLLEDIAFGELRLHKIYTYAFDLRPHLYTTVEKAGFQKEATLREHICFDGQYKNVIIHSKISTE